ncbi:MAG: 3D domain-containing protein [Desulfuromonadaceae bacterium]|nr:3D domain-containing protein [Desulfuromonadaceae bacterium]
MRVLVYLCVLGILCGCSSSYQKTFHTTAYCDCSKCCSWGRSFPDFWNRHFVAGPNKGDVYTGKTALGTKPREPYAGLLSVDTVTHPWTLPHRLILPWMWFPHDGTIAADWAHIPPRTRIYIPDYGWGRVEDKGSAIKGPQRLDLFFNSHTEALQWGRKTVQGKVQR